MGSNSITERPRLRTGWFNISIYAAIAVLIVVMQSPVDNLLKGWAGLLLMACVLIAGVPVGAAMGSAGLFGLFSVQGPRGAFTTLERMPYEMSASWSLSVLPMFILMGLLLWRSGATDKLYRGAEAWLSWLPGGLGVTTNTAGAALGAASGSTLGIAYALGRIGIPSMLAAGYPKRLAVSSVLMAGSGGQLIPPSILLVVFAGVAGTPVGDQLLAGFIPGLLLVSAYGLLIVAIGFRFRGKNLTTWVDRWTSLKHLWPIPTLLLIVIGGIYSGFFTATEAGAVGAFVALLLAFTYQRGAALSAIWQSLGETVSSVGSIFFLLIGSALLARFSAASGVTSFMVDVVGNLEMSRTQFLLVLVLFYLVLGTFVDPIAMVLLTVPPLMPILAIMEIELIWFGVFVVLMAEIAIITPPVGILLYVIHGIAQEPDVNLGIAISHKDVVIAAMYFLPIALLLALVLIAVPSLVEWLPSIANSRG